MYRKLGRRQALLLTVTVLTFAGGGILLAVPRDRLDAGVIAARSGLRGAFDTRNSVYTVRLGRPTLLSGTSLGVSSGVESWAAFSGSEESAVVNGDIASLELELPVVLRDLIGAGIQIMSIHSHLTQGSPRLVFVHYWGEGPLRRLTQGVKAAIWDKERFQSQ